MKKLFYSSAVCHALMVFLGHFIKFTERLLKSLGQSYSFLKLGMSAISRRPRPVSGNSLFRLALWRRKLEKGWIYEIPSPFLDAPGNEWRKTFQTHKIAPEAAETLGSRAIPLRGRTFGMWYAVNWSASWNPHGGRDLGSRHSAMAASLPT
jgi:hypothetical protein